MIAECIAGAAWAVKATSGSANPTATSPARYSDLVRAPAYPDPAARSQDAEHLGQHGGLVSGQVDHAVGDHHVHRAVWQGYVFDVALEEPNVRRSGLGGIGPGQFQHVVGHVHAPGEPSRADPPSR
jgi:hypothetical protein